MTGGGANNNTDENLKYFHYQYRIADESYPVWTD